MNDMETVGVESPVAEEFAAKESPPLTREVAERSEDGGRDSLSTPSSEGGLALSAGCADSSPRGRAKGAGEGEPRGAEEGGEAAAAPDPRLADVRNFTAHFPGVKGEDVPQEVWDMVKGGLPLTAAYAIHVSRTLRFELETLRQNAAARARSTGSMTGLGERRIDPLDEGWYDD